MTSDAGGDGGDSDHKFIRSIAESARDHRLIEFCGYDPERVNEMVAADEMTDPLLGHCPENAERLARRLYCHGYTPEIIYGAAVDGCKDLTVETVEEAFRLMYFHIWVEVPPAETDASQPLIAEIAAEPDGGIRVTDELPDNYTRPPESRVVYDPTTVTPKQLRSIGGYQNLKEKGLIQ